ncbi:hypothetical protein [Paraburkholderia kirstenboschensis]|uniref:Transposase n=1 Tax=Paraburkholderia kirstenboschensis TaxID=1245436 RepID=A0ABZ0EBA6_9BURK|nr:hypothetical protein [Paraburkholderia kirstenboschensis]WOD14494.1 hypothetical protein RW095_03245 [Paraburkholderia kirstenboschensis]
MADSRPKLDWVTEGQRVGISAAAIDAVFVGIRRPKRKLAQ